MPVEPNIDPKGQSTVTTDPSMKSGEGQSTDDLPEQFKGKSAVEIAKSYTELQKQLGKHSEEVGQTREEAKQLKQKLAEWESLGKVIESNPALYKEVETEIAVIARRTPSQETNPEVASLRQEVSDTRLATQGQIFEKFEGKYGLDRMKPEDTKAIQAKIGNELHELIDPKHTKSFNQIVASIPLDALPMYLDKAYHLATRSDEKERARMQGMIAARQNNDATFSSTPSTSIEQDPTKLSPQEKKVAQKLGIGEEKYLKQKKEILKEYN